MCVPALGRCGLGMCNLVVVLYGGLLVGRAGPAFPDGFDSSFAEKEFGITERSRSVGSMVSQDEKNTPFFFFAVCFCVEFRLFFPPYY